MEDPILQLLNEIKNSINEIAAHTKILTTGGVTDFDDVFKEQLGEEACAPCAEQTPIAGTSLQLTSIADLANPDPEVKESPFVKLNKIAQALDAAHLPESPVLIVCSLNGYAANMTAADLFAIVERLRSIE